MELSTDKQKAIDLAVSQIETAARQRRDYAA